MKNNRFFQNRMLKSFAVKEQIKFINFLQGEYKRGNFDKFLNEKFKFKTQKNEKLFFLKRKSEKINIIYNISSAFFPFFHVFHASSF
jgi:hypothetical protein